MEKLTAKTIDNQGMLNLIEGIVAQARKDWTDSMNDLNEANLYFLNSGWFGELKKQTNWERIRMNLKMAFKFTRGLNMLQDSEQFFLSRWFSMLTNLDGKPVVKKLKSDWFKEQRKKQVKKGRF